VAGPQLIIGESAGARVRCLNLRTSMVSTIAGLPPPAAHRDGPVSTARFHAINDLAVAPNGVLFVADRNAVRLISTAAVLPGDAVGSAAPVPAPAPAERMVTT
jgi:hypothetical protein